MQVLIVEDFAPVRAALRFVLELHGMNVIGEAAGGNEAIQLCQTMQLDVVILDFRLLELDGVTTLYHIRQHHPFVKAILLTGSLDVSFTQAKQAGFDVVLSKYDAASNLMEVIRSFGIVTP